MDERIASCGRAGEPTDDPVLFALADSQKRYNIPLELLEKLVHGTAMDVARQRPRRQRISGARYAHSSSTKPSISFTTTAITWRRSSAWCAFASSAIAIRARKSWRRRPALPFSSPTSCAT